MNGKLEDVDIYISLLGNGIIKPDETLIYKRFLTDESIFTDEYNNKKRCYVGMSPYKSNDIIEDKNDVLVVYGEYFYAMNVQPPLIEEMVSKKVKNIEEYERQDKDKTTYIMCRIKNPEDDVYTSTIFVYSMPQKWYLTGGREKLFDWISNEEYLFGATTGPVIPYEEVTEICYNFAGIEYDDESKKIAFKDYILENSDTIKLEKSKVAALSKDELNKAYNEIFARHGHDFSNKELKGYFYGKMWYLPTYGKKVGIEELSEIEKANAELIQEVIIGN